MMIITMMIITMMITVMMITIMIPFTVLMSRDIHSYDKSPELLIPPPSIVQAVQGESIIIKALYKGIEDHLLAVWVVTTPDGHHYILPTNNYTNYNTTIMHNCSVDYCYFTVAIEIKSLTLNLSQANLINVAMHQKNFTSTKSCNSRVGMNVLLKCFNVVITFCYSCQ